MTGKLYCIEARGGFQVVRTKNKRMARKLGVHYFGRGMDLDVRPADLQELRDFMQDKNLREIEYEEI